MNIAFLRSELRLKALTFVQEARSPQIRQVKASVSVKQRLPVSKQDDLWHLFICEACKFTVCHNGNKTCWS